MTVPVGTDETDPARAVPRNDCHRTGQRCLSKPTAGKTAGIVVRVVSPDLGSDPGGAGPFTPTRRGHLPTQRSNCLPPTRRRACFGRLVRSCLDMVLIIAIAKAIAPLIGPTRGSRPGTQADRHPECPRKKWRKWRFFEGQKRNFCLFGCGTSQHKQLTLLPLCRPTFLAPKREKNGGRHFSGDDFVDVNDRQFRRDVGKSLPTAPRIGQHSIPVSPIVIIYPIFPKVKGASCSKGGLPA
jgi:hypothetical protein